MVGEKKMTFAIGDKVQARIKAKTVLNFKGTVTYISDSQVYPYTVTDEQGNSYVFSEKELKKV